MSSCINCDIVPLNLETWSHLRIADNTIEDVRKITHDLVDIVIAEHKGKDRLMDPDMKACTKNHISIRFMDDPKKEGFIIDDDQTNYSCNIEFIAKPFKVYNMLKEFKIRSIKNPNMNFEIFDTTEVDNLGENLSTLNTPLEFHDLINKVKVRSL